MHELFIKYDSLTKKTVYSTNTGSKNLLTRGAKFTGQAFAYVINGVAHVSLEVTPSSAVEHGDVIVSGLPTPLSSVWYTSLCLTNGYSYTVAVIKNGLSIYYPAYTTASRIDASFSYPVL